MVIAGSPGRVVHLRSMKCVCPTAKYQWVIKKGRCSCIIDNCELYFHRRKWRTMLKNHVYHVSLLFYFSFRARGSSIWGRSCKSRTRLGTAQTYQISETKGLGVLEGAYDDGDIRFAPRTFVGSRWRHVDNVFFGVPPPSKISKNKWFSCWSSLRTLETSIDCEIS